MGEVVALPAPVDETGLKGDLMEAARTACETGDGIVAYAVIVMFADGSWGCQGRTAFGDTLTPMSAATFALLAGEALKSHFIGAPIACSRLDADEEC